MISNYDININENGFQEDEFLNIYKPIESLINNNVLDFIMIQKLSTYLSKYGNFQLYTSFFTLLKNFIQSKHANLLANKSTFTLNTIQSFLTFFMILILNQQKNKDFILFIFSSKFIEIIIYIGNHLPHSDNSLPIKSIIYYIFTDEYKSIFYRNPPFPLLEQLFYKEQANITKTMQYLIKPFPKETYHSILDYLLNFCISYDNIDTSNTIDKDRITQSIIRIVFSKDKYNYFYIEKLNEKKLSEEQYEHYEYQFIEKLIYKSIYEIKSKNLLSKIDKAFNVDNIYNDILKNVFKLYGNETIKTAYMDPLDELVEIIDEYGDGLNIGAFDEFMEKFIEGLRSMPKILKMILFLLYDVSCEILELKKDDYSIIFALLINSVILSPIVHTLFDNKVTKVSTIINIERIIRSIWCGKLFEKDDNLNEFNDTVKHYYKQMRIYVRDYILNFDKERKGKLRMKSYLRNISKNMEFVIPKFVFYIDCQNILSVLPCVQNGTNFKLYTQLKQE